MGRKRAAVAAALALLYPGLGHVYLREWIRAVAWFGTALAAAALVVPPSAVAAIDAGGLSAFVEAGRSLPRDALLPLLAVRALNVLDAARLGLRSGPSGGADAPTCPECGKELDADLAFCPWCSAVVDRPAGAPEGE